MPRSSIGTHQRPMISVFKEEIYLGLSLRTQSSCNLNTLDRFGSHLYYSSVLGQTLHPVHPSSFSCNFKSDEARVFFNDAMLLFWDDCMPCNIPVSNKRDSKDDRVQLIYDTCWHGIHSYSTILWFSSVMSNMGKVRAHLPYWEYKTMIGTFKG